MSISQSSICVVIPTFNRAETVFNLVSEFLEICNSFHHIVVVDDGSTDNTKALLSSLHSTNFHPLYISNHERGYARNYGYWWAKNNLTFDYVVFFDSDDKPLPVYFEAACLEIEAARFPAWLSLGYSLSNKLISRRLSIGKTKSVLKLLLSGNSLSPCSVFLRTDIAENFPFCESRDLAGSEDYELWIRIARIYDAPYFPDKIICTVNNWEGRSVNNVSPQKAIRQKNAFFTSLSKNEWNFDEMSSYRMIKGSIYVYTALQLSQYRKSKFFSIFYLIRGLLLNKPILLTKRPLAIIKHFLLTFK